MAGDCPCNISMRASIGSAGVGVTPCAAVPLRVVLERGAGRTATGVVTRGGSTAPVCWGPVGMMSGAASVSRTALGGRPTGRRTGAEGAWAATGTGWCGCWPVACGSAMVAWIVVLLC